ncbi:hypothetical protein SLS62_002691 [Diatrype stigma]|uniref:Uncharacterized protein n=1 Tax=Diatrype stigma TaxID=117547 RepID=A0AAN9UWI8_9PEZI
MVAQYINRLTMGLFSRSNESKDQTTASMTDQAPADAKEGLYVRYKNARMGRNNKISDEELEKFTGKDRVQLEKWAETTPGVGKNQISIAAACSPGIGGDLAAPAGPLGTNKPRDFSK